MASFALGRIAGAYAAGVAADRLGEQRTLLVGGLATAAIVLVASVMPLPVFVPLMVLAGAAGASATPAGGRLVLLAFPRNRHGTALGIRQTGIPVGRPGGRRHAALDRARRELALGARGRRVRRRR